MSRTDDDLTKPFEFDELLAHTRASLRRGQATEATQLAFGGLEHGALHSRALLLVLFVGWAFAIEWLLLEALAFLGLR